MYKLPAILLFLFTPGSVQAQQDHTGAYYAQPVAGTSSGFQLKADSTFIIFFSYGGLDRTGTGTWSVKGNRILFNSRPYPGSDFRLLRSEKRPGDSITIRIADPNKQLLQYARAGLRKGNVFPPMRHDATGNIRLAKQDFDAIVLAFEFCPERTSHFIAVHKNHNYFEFAFEEWMMEIFLKDFSLVIDGNNLQGSHPLDAKAHVVYEKE